MILTHIFNQEILSQSLLSSISEDFTTGLDLLKHQNYNSAIRTFSLSSFSDSFQAHHNKAVALFYLEDYEKSINSYLKSLEVNENSSDPSLEAQILSLLNLSQAYFVIGCFKKSKDMHQKAIDLNTDSIYLNKPLISIKLFQFKSFFLLIENDHKAAKICCQDSIQSIQKLKPLPILDLITFNYSLGIINFIIGKIEESTNNFESALSLYKNGLDAPNNFLPALKIATGTIFYTLGKHKEAFNINNEAIELLNKNGLKNSVYQGNAYNNLAFVWKDENRYDRSRYYLNEAKSIYVGRFGEDHPLMCKILNHLSLEDLRIDNDKEAFSKLEKAMSLTKKYFGDENLDSARILHNKGYVLDSQSKFDDALGYYFHALEIYHKVFDGKHPDLPIIYHNIGHIYSKKKGFYMTLKYYKKALDLKIGAIKERNDPGSAVTCRNYGYTLKRIYSYEEAKKYITRSFNIDFYHYGKTHYDITYLWTMFDLYEKIDLFDNSQEV